jgi:hypothetical protein
MSEENEKTLEQNGKRKRKWWESSWWAVIWLVIFPVVGILLMQMHDNFTPKTRIILSVISVVWLFAISGTIMVAFPGIWA